MCEAVYSPDQDIPAHVHPWAGFSLTLDGGYDEAYGPTMQHCSPASLVFHPAGEIFSDRISSGDGELLPLHLLLHKSGRSCGLDEEPSRHDVHLSVRRLRARSPHG